MLNLATEEVREYWGRESPELGRLLLDIERTEDWTLDGHPEIGDRLVRLGVKLADPAAVAKLAAADRNDLLFFLVYISSSKAMRLISWMDETQNGMGTRLLAVLLDQDEHGAFFNVVDPLLAGTLVQRLRVIRNTPFFEKILNPSLLDSIMRAIDNYREEKANHEA